MSDPAALAPDCGAPVPVPVPVPASAPVLGSQASTSPAVRRGVRELFVAVVALAVLGATWRMRGTLADAASAIAHLEAVTIAVIVGCWLVLVATRAGVYRLCHPRSTMAHGLVLDQVNLATGNVMPGGVVVGCAARYRVGRSFGQSPDGVALTMFAASQAFSLGRWLLVVVVVGRTIVVGRGSRIDSLALGGAVGAVLWAVALWAVIAHDTRFSRWAVSRVQALLHRVGRRVGRARDVPVVPFVDSVRRGSRWLLRERGWQLVLVGAAAGLAGAAIVVVVVHAIDGSAAPGTWDLLRAYLLARVASSVVPTPGNVGALEGALTASLVASGAGAGAAIAAVLVYRLVTYALPIATGSVAYLGWRRWERTRIA